MDAIRWLWMAILGFIPPGLDERIGQGGVSAMGGKWPVIVDGDQ